MNPVNTLYSWFQDNKELFISCGAELEFKDTGRNSAYVRLETISHMMELCAWDHACCLDIQIVEIESEKSIFPHTGDCESINEFKEHLKTFIIWFKGEFKQSA